MKKEFQWTDDEAELLLNVTCDYKNAKAMDNTGWESIKSKYEDIFELFRSELPTEPPSAAQIELINCNLAKNYPHTQQEVTKQIITTKLKAIRQKYRQAVDSGRHSGHGRVVLLYYEICEKVLGGSPATKQLELGIESNDLSISLEKLPTTAATSTGTSSTDNDPEDDNAQDGDVEDEIET